MEYIYQADFTEFPTDSYNVHVARCQRDAYARETLMLPDEFTYTEDVYNKFNQYTCNVWYNLDRIYCVKAAELHCRTTMNKKNKNHHLLVANGNVLYCREVAPTYEQITTIHETFLEWNGSNAASNIGGFPFAIYEMTYIAVDVDEDETSDELAEEFGENENQQTEESAAAPQQYAEPKPTIDLYDSEIPPPPKNSPVLRRSTRLAKKKARRSERLSSIPRVNYSGMD